jgi:HK97 family phage major capsid protein
MKKSTEIRQELSGIVSSQNAIIEKAKTENREALTAEERTAFDGFQTRINDLKGQLAVAELHEENVRSFGETATSVFETEKPNKPAVKRAPFSINKAIRSQMANGVLDGVELEIHNETKKLAERSGIATSGICIPLFDRNSVTTENRADGQTVTQDSGGYGAAFVPVETQPVIDLLRPQPVVERLGAVFLTGLQGDLKFPVNDGGIAATWEGEVTNVANTKNAYSSKTMKPNRLAVSVPISLQNLMQSSQDMEAYTMMEISTLIANAIDLAAINGSGTGQPMGILNASGVNSVAGGANGLAPSYDNVVALETAVFVANANSARLNYVSNAKVRGKLKTTPLVAGQPSYLMAPDGTVNGYPFSVSNHVPSNLTKGTATGVCSAAIFGDFSQLIIGQWGFMDISVDNTSRKREGYIEITVNVFVDVLVKQPKAFSVIKDLLTA